ncbi:MAG: cupin domain-containing protein [Desulfobacterales bacterium]|nr:cupin domain-containing protein [Desulfobacterales bacterium]
MTRFFPKETLSWEKASVRGGTVMDKCTIWEGDYDTRSAFFRMPKGMRIPRHNHPKWVQVMVVEGEMEVESDEAGKVRIGAGGCYFVETGDTHLETATQDTIVLVTQGEDRPSFLNE